DLMRLVELQAMEIHHATFAQDAKLLVERIEREMNLKQVGGAQESVAPGTVKIHPKDESPYVWIPAGTFQMNRVACDNLSDGRYDDEKPQHPVEIGRGFWLGRTPVTVAAFRRFVTARGLEMPRPPKYNPNWSEHEHPIVNV